MVQNLHSAVDGPRSTWFNPFAIDADLDVEHVPLRSALVRSAPNDREISAAGLELIPSLSLLSSAPTSTSSLLSTLQLGFQMGKHSRKKQKVSDEPQVHPLGMPTDPGGQEEKDEEELLLEDFLFGPAVDLDSSVSSYQPKLIEDTTLDVGNRAEHLPGRKTSVWTDSDDYNIQVSLAADKRRRKLRDAVIDDTVDGCEYERRLRREFEKANPSPSWAGDARNLPYPGGSGKRMRSSVSSDGEEEVDGPARSGLGLEYLLSGATSVLDTQRVQSLPQGIIAIERLRDANLSAKAEGEIKVVQFHPSPQVPVLLAGSSDRRLRIFNVGIMTSLPYHILNLCTGRRPYKPTSPHVAHPYSSLHQRPLPPRWYLRSPHWSAAILLHIRSPNRHYPTFSPRTVGNNVCRQWPRVPRWEHGGVCVRSNWQCSGRRWS